MLTVDFDRLGLRPGERVLDMGAGGGRHAFEMYRRGADVVAFDMDADELAGVLEIFGAMKDNGEVPEGAQADIKQGDALELPFADGEFDRIVAAEVLEHIHDDVRAITELVRVLRPGGTLAISVPRWLPEVINWKLSSDYHNATGGHIRIYTAEELIDKVTKAGRPNDGTPGDAMLFEGKDYAHGLHAPITEQPEYSMVRRDRVEKEILPYTEGAGIGLVVWSPLAMGLLTGKYDEGRPEGARLSEKENWANSYLTEENIQKVRDLKPIADDLGLTRAQLALAWLLRQPGVSSVITGATKVSQIQDTVKAAGVRLSDDVLARVEEILKPS